MSKEKRDAKRFQKMLKKDAKKEAKALKKQKKNSEIIVTEEKPKAVKQNINNKLSSF